MLSITGWMVVNPWLLGMPSPPWIVTPPSGTAPPTPRAPAPCKDNIVYSSTQTLPFRFRELLVHLARGHLQGPRCSPHQGANSWSSNTSRPELGRSLHVGHWVQHWGSDVGKALRNTWDNLLRTTMTIVQQDWKTKNTHTANTWKTRLTLSDREAPQGESTGVCFVKLASNWLQWNCCIFQPRCDRDQNWPDIVIWG